MSGLDINTTIVNSLHHLDSYSVLISLVLGLGPNIYTNIYQHMVDSHKSDAYRQKNDFVAQS